MKRSLSPLLRELADALGRPLDEPSLEALTRFGELVQQWNAHLDLTAAREPRAMVEVIFADAIVMSDPAIVPPNAKVLDVGSGSGAPAFPFALLRPDCRVTMLEPLRKRVAFLRTAIGSLDVASRVRAVEGRLDAKGRPSPALGEEYDLASARATFAPPEWLEKGLGLSPSCLVFAVESPPEPPAGASIAVRKEYALPWSGAPRVQVRYVR